MSIEDQIEADKWDALNCMKGKSVEREHASKLLDLAYALHAEYDVGDSEFGQQRNDAPDSLTAIIAQLEALAAPPEPTQYPPLAQRAQTKEDG